MFGYIQPSKRVMSEDEQTCYRGYYCGLCHKLKDDYGLSFTPFHNNDLTFLYLLLSGLEEPDEQVTTERCVIHPLRKVPLTRNEISSYCAAMTITLSYYKALDDVKDEGKHKKNAKRLGRLMPAIREAYPDTIQAIEDGLDHISALEDEECTDLDTMTKAFGQVFGAITAYDDAWHDELFTLGDMLGRFIYLMDAWDDLADDVKSGAYNPLKPIRDREDLETYVESLLEMMMAEAVAVFETLPVLTNASIIRGILYSGVWARFEALRKDRQ